MLNEFLVFLLYLFYGLAFFTMGVAITSVETSTSNLKLAKYLWLFALFAFTHACHEWFELYLALHSAAVSPQLYPFVITLKLVPMALSFLFLLFFGLSVLGSIHKSDKIYLYIIPVVLISLVGLVVLAWGVEPTAAFFRFADVKVRNFLGFPAAVVSGIAFLFYSGTIKRISKQVGFNFNSAGVALIIYGFLTGLVPSGTRLPLVEVPVELLRGGIAIVILHFVMKALHVFHIEQKYNMEERLHRFAQSEKLNALGKLAAGIAHEINNPLTNVSLNVEMLKQAIGSNCAPKVEKRFAAIERNVDRASKIAQELLYFSRDTDGEFVETDVNKLITGTLTLVGPRRNDYLMELDLRRVPKIKAIPWKLEEVFLNLLMNAMEATPSGEKITIRSYHRPDEVIVEIADTGAGIAPEDLNYIFDPFFTTKDVGQGTGLGLSICFGIMERHGGKIEVASESGSGTNVTLRFPIGV